MARCPAHEDRSPSLSIKETQDGKVLLHCFGGCGAADVVAAAGLTLSDLFPERLEHSGPRRDLKHRHAAVEALKQLAHESLVVALAAENLAHGMSLSNQDRGRLLEAAGIIRAARDAVA